MTTLVTNVGDAPSFFSQVQAANLPGGVLINTQIDPTLPENTALQRVTDPLLPDQHFLSQIKNFDPDIYDLRSTSHIVRLLKALLGGAGIGGLKKQVITQRLNGTLAITAFADLDKFYGAIFNFNRYSIESMPTLPTGTRLNPYTDVATPELWDEAYSSDARYRSRVYQVARAINMGGSVAGIKGVAEALLSTEVDLAESWVKVDESHSLSNVATPAGLSYANITHQYPTFGTADFSYNTLEGGQYGAGVAPTGNRSEVVVTPRRLITDEEQLQLAKVLRTIRPSHTQITLGQTLSQSAYDLAARQYFSDSEDWDVVARITPQDNLNQPANPLYANAGTYSVARPAFSEYSGEEWTYNTAISNTYTYRIVSGQTLPTNPTVETITYQDQSTHTYAPGDAVMDVRQALSPGLSGDGVVTSFPFVGNR